MIWQALPYLISESGGHDMRAVTKERRKVSESHSVELRSFLNTDQRISLQQMENFGWSLKYVRRPLFMEPVAIVFHRGILEYAVLDLDGTLNRAGDVDLRDSAEPLPNSSELP